MKTRKKKDSLDSGLGQQFAFIKNMVKNMNGQ
jgi:hypothetical protein